MKKYVYGVLFLASVGMSMVGCKKMNPATVAEGLQNETKYVSVETIRGLEKTGSILRFETIEDYVDFVEDSIQIKWQRIDDFTAAQGFENYFVQNPIVDEEDSLAMDDMFGKLLNADAVVIIGDYAVKVDLPNEAVFVAPYNNLAGHYADLIAGNTGNKNVKKFSTDDDVIDYLLTGVDFEKCGGSASFDQWSNNIFPFDNNSQWFKWRIRYFKSGIYFAVRAKVYHYNTPWPWNDYSSIKFEIRDNAPQNWKGMRMRPRPCSGNNNVFHHAGIRAFSGFGPLGTSSNPIVRTWLGYERVRGLNGYRVWIKGVYEKSPTEIIKTNQWIGREIHSNF